MSDKRVLKAIEEYHFDPNYVPDNGHCVFAWGLYVVAGDGKTPLKDLEPINIALLMKSTLMDFAEKNRAAIDKMIKEDLLCQ